MMPDQKMKEEMAGKAPKNGKKVKGKSKAGTTPTTSIQVDEEENLIADSLLEALAEQKGKATLRMLRVNRISILRLALGIGLEQLKNRATKNEPIL